MADPLYAVADGMGGAAAGEVASEIAVSALAREFDKSGAATADDLVAAARAANRAVWEEAEAHLEMRGMGTTLVALILTESGELAAVNIGDSRLYAFHDGELRQVTSDHNLVAEMVPQGRLSPSRPRSIPGETSSPGSLGSIRRWRSTCSWRKLSPATVTSSAATACLAR